MCEGELTACLVGSAQLLWHWAAVLPSPLLTKRAGDDSWAGHVLARLPTTCLRRALKLVAVAVAVVVESNGPSRP
jgi:hypothetical protein